MLWEQVAGWAVGVAAFGLGFWLILRTGRGG
jgi:hypothetical protein